MNLLPQPLTGVQIPTSHHILAGQPLTGLCIITTTTTARCCFHIKHDTHTDSHEWYGGPLRFKVCVSATNSTQ